MGRAIRRFCQEYPWTADGLALTQRLVLQLIAERPRPARQVYHLLMTEREPLPWLADLMFRDVLDVMTATRIAAIRRDPDGEGRNWSYDLLTIEPAGQEVLDGSRSWFSLAPPERWLGGVRIGADAACWMWDEPTGSMIER